MKVRGELEIREVGTRGGCVYNIGGEKTFPKSIPDWVTTGKILYTYRKHNEMHQQNAEQLPQPQACW